MQQKNLVLPAGFVSELEKVAFMKSFGGLVKGITKKRDVEELMGDRKILRGTPGALWEIGANWHKTLRAGLAARSGQKIKDQAGQIFDESKKGLSGLGSSVKNVFSDMKAKEMASGRKLSLKEKLDAASGSIGDAGKHFKDLSGIKDKHSQSFLRNAGRFRTNVFNAMNPEKTITGRALNATKASAGGALGLGVIGAGTIGYDAVTRDPSLLYNAGMGSTIRAGASWY